MRPSTRSAGKPKTPIRSEDRMTRFVTLSRARPRKPLRSPAATQRDARDSAGADVGGGAAGEERPRLLADALGERGAPRQLAAMLRDLMVIERHQAGRVLAQPQPGAVRAALALVVVVQHRLDARVLTLGVRVEEHAKPTLDVVVGAARKHARIVAGFERVTAAARGAASLPATLTDYRLGRIRRRLRCWRGAPGPPGGHPDSTRFSPPTGTPFCPPPSTKTARPPPFLRRLR